jgi:hypothetical protein
MPEDFQQIINYYHAIQVSNFPFFWYWLVWESFS